MESQELKQKTILGTLWSTAQKGGAVLLSFISSIVLARLLTPEDYGCIGMLSIFLALSGTLIDGGFGSSLIQKHRPSEADYSTMFYWNIFISLVLYAVLYFSAPFIAVFYNLEILCKVLRIQGIVIILNAIRFVQTNQLRKQLKFKKITIINLSVSAFSLVVTIILAYHGWKVWALVAQQIIVSFLTTLLYWITSRWRPLLVFSTQSFKELFSFGGFILLSNLINTFCNNIQGLLIGKFYNASTLGYFSKAKSTEEIPSKFISDILDQVSYPVLAEVQHDNTMIIKILKKFISCTAFIVYPAMSILILLAKPIFVLLYSDRWLESVPYFQVLCFAGFFICLQNINYYAIAAIGKSKVLFKWTLIKRIIGLSLVVSGLLLFGVYGLLVCMVCTSFIIYVINAGLVSKHVGYTLAQQAKDILPILAITSILSVLIYFTGNALDLNMYLRAGIEFVVFALIYLLCAKLFLSDALNSMVEIIRIVRHRKH